LKKRHGSAASAWSGLSDSDPIDVAARIMTGKAPVDRQVKNKEKGAQRKAAQAERKKLNARKAKEASQRRKGSAGMYDMTPCHWLKKRLTTKQRQRKEQRMRQH